MGERRSMLSVLQSFECHQVGVITLQEKLMERFYQKPLFYRKNDVIFFKKSLFYPCVLILYTSGIL